LTWAILNHEYVQSAQASVPIQDRGFLFGDGVFTSARVENGNVVHWGQHVSRLIRHCREINIQPPDLKKAEVDELILRNQAEKGTWKLKMIVTGGTDPGLSLPSRAYGVFLVTMEPYQEPEGKVKLCRYPHPIETPVSALKTLSYLPRLMVRQYALDQGADDAVVCSADGWVLEAAFSNLYWEEGGEVFAPPLTLPLLPGTYLSTMTGWKEERITYDQLKEKESVFICNAMGSRACTFN